MADFPTSVPSITNPTANDTLAAVPHHEQHEHANDNLAAIAAKVGTGSSTPTVHQLLIGSGTGTSAWGSVIGSGSDDYSSAPPRLINVLDGTYAAPITTLGPTVRISRHEAVPSSVQANPADNSQNAALHVFSHGTINDEVQATGIFSFAHGGSDTLYADLLGVGGLARVLNTGATSVAGGGYFEGRRDVDTAIATYGIECRSTNYTATDSTYSSSTYSPVMGLWVTSSGTAKIGAHIAARALDAAAIALTGIGFVAGSVQDSTFRDDTSATRSVDIRGSHTIGVDLSNATLSSAAILLPNAGSIRAMNAAGSVSHVVINYNSSDVVILGDNSSARIYSSVQHSFAGGGIYIAGQDIETDTTTGTKIGTGSSQKLGFYGATPIVRPSGVAVSAAGIHAALVSLGLIAA